MRKVLLALGLIGLSAPANAIVTVYFQGADAKNWVSGSFSYDSAVPGDVITDLPSSFEAAEWIFPSFNFTSNFFHPFIGRADYSGAYRLVVSNAFTGNSEGSTDQIFAHVYTHEDFGFNLNFAKADALDSLTFPADLPAGDAQFGYSFKGDGFVLPVQYSLAPFASAVPEPETWALMLFGFGTVASGLRLRRRRRPALA